MGIYDKYVLVTDMDGTLVNSQGIISEENKAAIAEFTAEGGHFAVATGRTPANSERFIKDLAISTSCIFYNGAMLYDWQKQAVLATEALKGKIWRDFLENCLHKFPTACLEIYTPEKCYVVSDPANDDPNLEEEHYIYEHVAVEQVKDETWLKFFVCDEPEVLKQVELEAEAFGVAEIHQSLHDTLPVLLQYLRPPADTQGAAKESRHCKPVRQSPHGSRQCSVIEKTVGK